MAPCRNARVLLNSVPKGLPVLGQTLLCDTSQALDPGSVALNGGFLVQVLVLSVDPYLRGRIPDRMGATYIPWFEVGQPIATLGIGKVLRSENASVKSGEYVYGIIEAQEYILKKELSPPNPLEHLTILKNAYNLPWSAFLGVLGMPGRTAFYAWNEYSRAKRGETVFVSTAAGAVGSFVVQLAKRDGCKVISSVGNDEKVAYALELGSDVAFNYKTTETAEFLTKQDPIDIYWDNVGGKTLDAALNAANFGARFIECGMITGYNDGYASTTVQNLFNVVPKSITMTGFVNSPLGPLEEKYGKDFMDKIPPLVASGELKHREHVYVGIESFGEALLAVFTGQNNGKVIVRVVDH